MKKKTILQVLVVLLTIVLWVVPAEWLGIDGLTVIQQRTLAIFVFAALMWLFEIIPAWATSVVTIVALLPFAVFAITGVFKEEDFSSIEWHILWMVAGGFALGTCLNETGLDAA